MYVYTYVCLYMEAREQFGCHYSGTIHLLFFVLFSWKQSFISPVLASWPQQSTSLQFPKLEIANKLPHLALFHVFWESLKCFCLQHKFSQLGPFLSPMGCLLLLLFLIEYCFHCIIDIFCNSDYQKDKIFGIKKFITWRVRHEHIHSKIFYSSFFISLKTLLSSKFSMGLRTLLSAYTSLAFIVAGVNCHSGTKYYVERPRICRQYTLSTGQLSRILQTAYLQLLWGNSFSNSSYTF